MPDVQDCRQCGKCCEKWGWDQYGIIEDLAPWIENNRTDILRHVGIRFTDGRRSTGRDLVPADLPRVVRIYYWVEPTGKKRTSCPFYDLRTDGKVYCRIHDTKSAVCIGFTPWDEGSRDYALNCKACRNNAP